MNLRYDFASFVRKSRYCVLMRFYKENAAREMRFFFMKSEIRLIHFHSSTVRSTLQMID